MVELPKSINLMNYKQFDVNDRLEKSNDNEEIQGLTSLLGCYSSGELPSGLKSIDNMHNISFGHFVIIEKLITRNVEEQQMLQSLMPYLLRPSEEGFLDNEDLDAEAMHSQTVLNVNIGVIQEQFIKFNELRTKYLFKDYNGVIYATIEKETDEKDEDDSDEETNVDSSDTARGDYNKRFFWYNLIGSVCDGDIFRRSDALNLPMYEVMPFFAEKRYKEIIERLERR